MTVDIEGTERKGEWGTDVKCVRLVFNYHLEFSFKSSIDQVSIPLQILSHERSIHLRKEKEKKNMYRERF